MKNKVVFAAAGNGKTYNICAEAIQKANKNDKFVLLLSYTNEGVNSIKTEYAKQNKGIIDQNIIIKTWYSFLLSDWIKPYQCLLNLKYKKFSQEFPCNVPENHIRSIAFYQDEKPKWYTAKHIQYYINNANDVRRDEVSHLAFICNLHSKEKVLKRLSDLYSDIFIDELQDYAGWDLELFNILLGSNIPITCVGDYKQSTYRTNNSIKNKKYRDSNILNYFILKEKNKVCTIEYSQKTRRLNRFICDYVNTIFNDDNNISPYITNLNEDNENVGVYIIEKKDIGTYCNFYNPTILRYSAITEVAEKNCPIFTYGASKGMTVDRVVILPIKTILPFILEGKAISSKQTKAKFYVACTRAKYSLVFIVDNEVPIKYFKKEVMRLGDKTIPCYKFYKEN